MDFEGAGSPADSVLVRLALASTTLHPDDISDVFVEEVAKAGLGDAAIYLACLEQKELIAFGPKRDAQPSRLPVGDSAAGTAYRRETPVVETAPGGGSRTWFPLMDSAERLGVVSIDADTPPSHPELETGQALANMAAELIANKMAYGDSITQTRRTRPLTVAAELRWSMLPPLTFTGQNLTISGIVAPAYEIAGDTFDYAVNGGAAHVMILDAVGHGLEAARIANLAVAVYRNSRRCDLDLVDTYGAMNEIVSGQFGPEKFATAQVATVELSTGRLSWVNAGHPSPMVIRAGVRVDLPSVVWLPVGLADERTAKSPLSEAQLEPGDVVVFFTDGVIEARSDAGDEFGRDRLGEVLERAAAAGEKPAETLRLVAQDLRLHQRDTLRDDATLLLVVWNGPPE